MKVKTNSPDFTKPTTAEGAQTLPVCLIEWQISLLATYKTGWNIPYGHTDWTRNCATPHERNKDPTSATRTHPIILAMTQYKGGASLCISMCLLYALLYVLPPPPPLLQRCLKSWHVDYQPDFKPIGTRFESVNYGISKY